jgi:hypothetical protein
LVLYSKNYLFIQWHPIPFYICLGCSLILFDFWPGKFERVQLDLVRVIISAVFLFLYPSPAHQCLYRIIISAVFLFLYPNPAHQCLYRIIGQSMLKFSITLFPDLIPCCSSPLTITMVLTPLKMTVIQGWLAIIW